FSKMSTSLGDQGITSKIPLSPGYIGKRDRLPSSSASPSKIKRSKSTTPTESNENKTKSGRATTFGIEFELTLAFHEEFLEQILCDYKINAEIVKALTNSQHYDLLGQSGILFDTNRSHNFRSRYPSWGLQVPSTDVIFNTLHFRQKFPTTLSANRNAVRRYVMEPLLMAKERFQHVELPCNVVGWAQPDGFSPGNHELSRLAYPDQHESILIRNSDLDYSHWTVTNDDTLIGLLESQLQSRLSELGISEKTWPLWDSHGIELISPIFTLAKKDEALLQIEKYLEALSSDRSMVLPSVWASTHVHIGFDFKDSSDISTPIFQHLIYILLLHEDLISKCFPRSRSGIKIEEQRPEEPLFSPLDDDDEPFDPDEEFGPPQLSEEEDAEIAYDHVLTTEAKYTGLGNVESNLQYFRDQAGPEANGGSEEALNIENSVFTEHDDIISLIAKIQRPDNHQNENGPRFRGYIYNFANLWAFANNETNWKPIKPTVEFRQHDCTTGADIVKHWIIFLEALIKAAEQHATKTIIYNSKTRLDISKAYSAQQRDKYPSGEAIGRSWPYDNMYRFCVSFLGLNKEEASYWQERYDLHANDRPSHD
ncbi:uncharacterized protein A1O9_01125, partial [Exophiala aquamarina CBS 119918]